MNPPIINFQDYLLFRKDDFANASFGVLYDQLSSVGKNMVDDDVASEYIKIFNLLYNKKLKDLTETELFEVRKYSLQK